MSAAARRICLVTVALLVTGLAAPALGLAEPVRIKGTKVALEVPAGFAAAEKFPGLQHPEHPLASIVVTEVPAPAATLRAAFNKEMLASRGLTFVALTDVTVGGAAAHLLEATQDTPLGTVGKWLLLTGSETSATLLTATYPQTSPEIGAALRTALLSATWAAAGSVDPFEGLTYRVKPGAKLPLATRVTNSLLFSETGQPTQTDATRAMFIVGTSINASTIADVKQAAELRLAGFVAGGQLADLGEAKATLLQVDGLDACELVADATDVKSKTPLTVYLVLIAEPGKGYYLTTGMVGRSRASEWLPAFRAATATLVRATP
jgi:hypothetical protein